MHDYFAHLLQGPWSSNSFDFMGMLGDNIWGNHLKFIAKTPHPCRILANNKIHNVNNLLFKLKFGNFKSTQRLQEESLNHTSEYMRLQFWCDENTRFEFQQKNGALNPPPCITRHHIPHAYLIAKLEKTLTQIWE